MQLRLAQPASKSCRSPEFILSPLHLDAPTFRLLLEQLGPSLALWRAAEVAALREQHYQQPIVDLGCGDGLISSLVLSSIAFGVDPDRTGLAKAARRGVYWRLLPVAAAEARMAPGSIGTVVSNSVMEHVEPLDGVLQAVSCMLRPGGRFIFTTPTEAFSRFLAMPFSRYAAWRNRKLEHVNLWPLDLWVEELEPFGLRVELVRPYLQRRLVFAWDAMDMAETLWVGRYRLAGLLWRRLTRPQVEYLARRASRLDLSAAEPGGGRLIVARKD